MSQASLAELLALQDEWDLTVGRVVRHAVGLDTSAPNFLALLVERDFKVVMELAGWGSASRVINVIARVSPDLVDKTLDTQVQAWVEAARRFLSGRNMLVHGSWIFGETPGTFSMVNVKQYLRQAGAGDYVPSVVSLSDARAVLEQGNAVDIGLGDLNAQLVRFRVAQGREGWNLPPSE